MHPAIRILAFAGSTRQESSNRKLLHAAAAHAAGAQVSITVIDLKEYPLPLFDADLEAQGAPDALPKLRALLAEHDGLILASPEYNGFFTPLLKNTLDWLSRPTAQQARHALFAGLPVMLLSAVGGQSGGAAGLCQLRQQLGYLKALPHARQFILPQAGDAFDAPGNLADPLRSAELAEVLLSFLLVLRTEVVQAA